MRTGPKLKGKAVAATQGMTRNQPDTLRPQLRSKAVAPTQGISRNHPNTATSTGKHAKIGVGVPNSAWANSRTPVHPKFDTKKKHD